MSSSITVTEDTLRLRAERGAVQTLYRAFSNKSPDLLPPTEMTSRWRPGRVGPNGLKSIIREVVEAMPDVRAR
jgi:hypothetical protein